MSIILRDSVLSSATGAMNCSSIMTDWKKMKLAYARFMIERQLWSVFKAHNIYPEIDTINDDLPLSISLQIHGKDSYQNRHLEVRPISVRKFQSLSS